MTEPKGKGAQYRAITNVSFGKDRSQVKAGETFFLDDEDQAKDLIARGAISKNVKPSADDLAKESPTTDPNVTAPEATTEPAPAAVKVSSPSTSGKTAGGSK